MFKNTRSHVLIVLIGGALGGYVAASGGLRFQLGGDGRSARRS